MFPKTQRLATGTLDPNSFVQQFRDHYGNEYGGDQGWQYRQKHIWPLPRGGRGKTICHEQGQPNARDHQAKQDKRIKPSEPAH